jgi:hypothetical protein
LLFSKYLSKYLKIINKSIKNRSKLIYDYLDADTKMVQSAAFICFYQKKEILSIDKMGWQDCPVAALVIRWYIREDENFN